MTAALPYAQQQPAGTPQLQAGTAPAPDFSVAPYDVASIRRAETGRTYSHFLTTNGNMLGENVTLLFLIRWAYDIPSVLLEGGPSWINQTAFDIKAKKVDVAPVDRTHLTMAQLDDYELKKNIPAQLLLEDRFHLKMHREEQVKRFYAMDVAKGGITAKPSHATKEEQRKYGNYPGILGLRSVGKGHIAALGVTLDQLAHYLTAKWGSDDIGQPILNKTGLHDAYDFELMWKPGLSTDDGDAPSLFTALAQQLGIKVEQQKGPIEVTVIDGAELPSEN